MSEQATETFDAAGQIDLFDNVVITEDSQGVRFNTPERRLQSHRYGSFALKVFGKATFFKEHDDYGNVRYVRQREEITGAIWAPHLFPFESVNPATNLPEITDRERCSFAVTLRQVEDGLQPVPRPREIAVHSSQGLFAALPNKGLSMPGEDLYNEFHWFEHDAIGQQVEWLDEASPSIEDFLGELSVSDPERGMRVLSGEEELPYEFEKARKPLDYRTRKPWLNKSGWQAFGSIWVPVDKLRRGIDAQIEFLMFQ